MDSSSSCPSEIYLDACATTPPRPEVIQRIFEVQESAWGNPSSLHGPGLIAAELLERSRQKIASCLMASSTELVLTSGATESIHLGLLGMARSMQSGRLVISAVEHPAVLAAAQVLKREGWEVCYWPVDPLGRVKLEDLDLMLAPPTRLVSIIWGQSEVGTIQPIETIGLACRERGIVFHTDATQVLSQGLLHWADLPIDLLSASAHKFQGPKGIGLLLLRPELIDVLQPLQGGGGQEQGLRAGTESVALVAGMAMALEHLKLSRPGCADVEFADQVKVQRMRDALRINLQTLPGLHFTGDPINRLPHHISMLVGSGDDQPISGRAVVRELSRLGVATSSGSACMAGQPKNSAVLQAMQIKPEWLQSGLRFSLGSWLDETQLDQIPDLLQQAMIAAASPE
ncbi:MAG: cysteine desulfurase family protein [Cyanobacteriota bacterium]|nr:cysteine desulfurase family protein [Cyanobacteriota bacterium]